MTKTLQKFGLLLKKEIDCMDQGSSSKNFLGQECGKDALAKAKYIPGLKKAYDLLVGYVMYVDEDDVDNYSEE